MVIQYATKEELLNVIENEGKIRVDSMIEGAIELAEEVHFDVKREDGKSSFLETHIWPVTIDVIRHYRKVNKLLTNLQVVSAILHDVMEDNEKILDLYAAKSYGFDAYFRHKFGDYVYNIAMTLKTKPVENFAGQDEREKKTIRFLEYCNDLINSNYDVKIIKLCDRLNNMRFMTKFTDSKKIQRYLLEAEDFYIAYTIFPPMVNDFYKLMRQAYNELKQIKLTVSSPK